MTQFTPAAEGRLGEYLRQVRAAAARSPGVSPDEIEADIRDHIDTEFHAAVGPVGLAELEAVLVRLGPPGQWVPVNSAAPPGEILVGRVRTLREWFRQTYRATLGVLWRGPEDWRLPYLAFGVFALGVVAFPLFPLFLLVSYVLARAGIAAAAEKGVTLGARRWLVYPPVVLVAVPLLLATLFWPVLLGVGAAEELWEADRFRELIEVRADGTLALTRPVQHEYQLNRLGIYRTRTGFEMAGEHRAYYEALNRVIDAFPGPRPAAVVQAVVFAGAGAFAAWWTVLGAVGWAFPGLARGVFAPLAGGWEARHGRRLFTLALVGVVLWAGFAYRAVSGPAVL